jgi:hypothetical protein
MNHAEFFLISIPSLMHAKEPQPNEILEKSVYKLLFHLLHKTHSMLTKYNMWYKITIKQYE